MAERKSTTPTRDAADVTVTKVEETKAETVKEERPITEDAKEEVEPDRPLPVTPRPSPRPTEPTRPVGVPVTPRPSLINATAVDAAFQTILDNLPRATFDHSTNRMLLDVINNVTRCRAKTSNFFKRI